MYIAVTYLVEIVQQALSIFLYFEGLFPLHAVPVIQYNKTWKIIRIFFYWMLQFLEKVVR